MPVFERIRESKKGLTANPLLPDLSVVSSDYLKQYSIKDPIRIEKVYKSDILDVPRPKTVEYGTHDSSYYVDLYTRASYYFFHCSILSTAILRIQQEALRNGIAWQPKFQSKCPRCGTEYQRSMKKCTQCGFEGEMLVPDVSQQKLLINYEGGSLFDKANKNGWTLLQLCRSFLIITLTYNQPVILCKSVYLVDEHKNVIDEFPQEFIPVSPAKCKMIYDDAGTPGDEIGFSVDDRSRWVNMTDNELDDDGYYEGKRIYPAHWIISKEDGGQFGEGEAYAEQEIYHATFGLPSMNYGLPLCLLVESDVRAWMAMELRIEKYYSVGHPSGLFVINNTTNESLTTVQQSIRIQMKDDPYTIPIIGIPPASDKVTSTKWHPLADNPTEQMMAVKNELQERICAIFGISGLFLGDMNSLKGNANEGHQMDVMDRNLVTIRNCVNDFLKFVQSKYKGITDWVLALVEPPDNQSLDEAEKFNKNLMNAKMAKDLGFDIISQADGNIEISDTPRSYDPIKSLFDPDDGGADAQGLEDEANQQGVDPFGADYGTSKLSESKDTRGNTFLELTKGTVEVDADEAERILRKHGVILRH